MKPERLLFPLLILWFLSACSGPKAPPPASLFTEMDPQKTGITFTNEVQNSNDLNIFTYRNFYNGGGVAIGDLNNDGLQDVYLTANMGPNKLFLNKGDWKFEDITAQSGTALENAWSTGVVMVDLNHDGLLDIYVCNAGFLPGQSQRNALFINQGDLTFTESASEYGLADEGYATHAAFLDYDKDGDLDMYLLNNSFIPTNTLNYSNKRDLPAEDWPVKDFLKGGGDKFFRNDEGKFTDVSAETGIYRSLIGFGLGVTVGDINDDGYDDLYISNDFFEKDYLYINQKDGTFKDQMENYFEHISHSSMGADLGDINNDGMPDLVVTDMLPDDDYRLKTNASFDDINLRRLKEDQGFYHQYMHNTLQINAGKKFKDISFHAGVAGSDWSWGALLFDADNDGLSDIFICNGIYHDVIDLDFMDFFANEVIQKMVLSGEKEEMSKVIDRMPSHPIPNKAFRNLNGLDFEDAGKQWGFDKPTFSNGAAFGDLDNDGDPDLIINNENQPALIYRNNSSNRSLTVKLQGEGDNPRAIGAKIYLYAGNGLQYRHLNPSRGFQSSMGYDLIFGLGENNHADSLKVVWPDGQVGRYRFSPSDSVLIANIRDASAGKERLLQPKNTLFSILPATFPAQPEDDHIDYYFERGLYRLLSYEGPAATTGDLNKDGLDDLFIGGSKGQPGSVYFQQKDGWKPSSQKALEADAGSEDTAAALFDADNDGDLDLLVGKGGNFDKPNQKDFLDRLYLNDGKGNFTLAENFDPEVGMNTSVILPMDFDGDGDLDLFIGSRSVPQHYGYSPVHFLFENDGKGNFTEVSETLANYFKGVGMISSAVWVNVLGDEKNELIMVGDWEYPRIFEWTGSAFAERTTNLKDFSGWYYRVVAADMDGDGDQDLILGNHGSNSYLFADQAHPVSLWMNDFDDNGFVDRILTRSVNGKEMPVMLKKDLADQIVSIKKKSIKNADYATLGIHDLLPPEAFDGAKQRLCTFMESAIAWNEGDGNFTVSPLPGEAQLSSVKAILATDLNQDGKTDLIIGGNDYHLIPQFSRLDASFGQVLLQQGDRSFKVLKDADTGLWIEGEIKSFNRLRIKGKETYVAWVNKAAPVFFQATENNLWP